MQGGPYRSTGSTKLDEVAEFDTGVPPTVFRVEGADHDEDRRERVGLKLVLFLVAMTSSAVLTWCV